MDPAPAINCQGPVPERHADRVVAEMLRFIAREHAGTYHRVIAAIQHDRCGNPTAQRRTVERIRRAAGPTLIDVELTPGKRGRYTIEFFDWVGWNEQRGEEIAPGDPLPPKPWLACSFTVIKGTPTGRDAEAYNCLLITHHALSRLAQRAGARSIADLITATAAIWRAYHAYRKTRTPGTRTPEGTRLAFALPGGSSATAVTRLHAVGGIIIATII
jgi:hypothetical protein